MNLLYIHGLDSSPRPDKVAVLQDIADNVWAPQLNYRENPDTFAYLLEGAKKREINYIVGSSAGGFMGYWLAPHLQCKALLFNPALAFQSIIQQIVTLTTVTSFQPFYSIILGGQDEVIPPQTTLDFLMKHNSPTQYYIDHINSLGHQIDMPTYEYACYKYIVK
ncbi:YqiA/YcfP family alpha/beta fold hydrolase [uncultured Microscilla sp.]|uniref:YqiA/YcfP family alpha/beta fold hydrolase n=1 Tax=uncultured Microscilla sp. TaxID=432653 RepID=UPI002604DEFA|nr:YqiA/YcfP family alpha/beta fold hydrolase [uncultured Microscilla sp.]